METNNISVEEIKPKEKFTGTVAKVTLAGAIVDIGTGVPGVVHISRLRKDPVNRVKEVVEVGESIDVWVRQVFPRRKRIELTMIEPLPLEWREINKGMVVEGKVTRLEKYGAFVDIGAERPGLIHISELAHGYIDAPSDIVKKGDEVEVKVISVNRRRKQIKLSVKALTEAPEKAAKSHQVEASKHQKPTPTAMAAALKKAMGKK
ncbi:MAG: S1 RNA-binding domain-containing protein [Chloroflexota bacterium]|nr:S1 RNA-binding domain-containing protein [Chloroflexota bacterium]